MNKREIPGRPANAALNGDPPKSRIRKSGKTSKAHPLVPASPRPSLPGFWESTSLDELAQDQGVGPLTDFGKITGTWPGEIDDGFEDAIAALRTVGITGKG